MPHPIGFAPHWGAHYGMTHIDWSKIEPEDRWVLLCCLGGIFTLIVCLFGLILCIDDAPAPEAVRKTVRKKFSAAEKAV